MTSLTFGEMQLKRLQTYQNSQSKYKIKNSANTKYWQGEEEIELLIPYAAGRGTKWHKQSANSLPGFSQTKHPKAGHQ